MNKFSVIHSPCFSKAILFTFLACSCLVAPNVFAQKNAFHDFDELTGSTSEEPTDNTADSMGIMNEVLLMGSDGTWSGSVEGTNYRLKSDDADNDIKYFYANTDQETWGSRTIKVKVEVRSGTAAGMIYGFQEDPKRYFLIIVDSKNTLKIYERTPEKFEERLSSSIDHKGGPVAFEIREDGNYIDLLVNDRKVIGFGNDTIGKGAVGIAAANTGDYVFSDFELTVK